MNINQIQDATQKLTSWIQKHGQSIGLTQSQCANYAAHGIASQETMSKLNQSSSPTMG